MVDLFLVCDHGSLVA